MSKRISDEERIFEYFQNAAAEDALKQYEMIGVQLRMRGVVKPPQDGRRRQSKVKDPEHAGK